jgi:hypothetical protein
MKAEHKGMRARIGKNKKAGPLRTEMMIAALLISLESDEDALPVPQLLCHDSRVARVLNKTEYSPLHTIRSREFRFLDIGKHEHYFPLLRSRRTVFSRLSVLTVTSLRTFLLDVPR